MTLIEAYTLYTAMRLHFTTDKYNISVTKGRVKVRPESIERNVKLKFFLEKYRKKYPHKPDFILFLVANFVYGDEWAGVYQSNGHVENFQRLTAALDRLTYQFQNDLKTLINTGYDHPSTFLHGTTLQKLYYSKHISLESVVVLDKLYQFVDHVQTNDPLWTLFARTIKKYSPFLKTDREKLKHIVGAVFGMESVTYAVNDSIQ